MTSFPEEIIQRLSQCRVVAGFSVNSAEHAVLIAKALLAGGIGAIELTLRTPAAMDGLRAICKEVPDMLIGAGTILTPETVAEVKKIGAHFGVSPGMNPRVIHAAQKADLPFAPGICTPTELESAIELDCRFVKFFPAEPSGGLKYLRSMAAPYKHLNIQYFPLGGLNAENMIDYLKDPAIPAIGGSWIVTKELVDNRNWEGITSRASEVIQATRKGLTNE